jgi:hypothetical protein
MYLINVSSTASQKLDLWLPSIAQAPDCLVDDIGLLDFLPKY